MTMKKEYPKPALTADILVFTKNVENEREILLIQRKNDPFAGMWALPGGFVDENEAVGEVARRELQEETGVLLTEVTQMRTYSMPHRDPRGWTVSVAHIAFVEQENLCINAGDDAVEAAWFTLRWKKGNDEIVLQLQREKDIFEVRLISAGVAEDGYRIIKNGGLAFDHAKMIVAAIEEYID
jgi:8-oxo-dGTP diphosphatase